MKLLSTLLFLGLVLTGGAWGASTLPVPAATGMMVPVVDGCPPGYHRNLQADCVPDARPPGYGLPQAPPGYGVPPPAYRPPACQPGFHLGQDGRCWPNRQMACPPNQHLGADGRCWPCPPGQHYRDGRCWPCPAGQHMGHDGRCWNDQPQSQLSCPPGYRLGNDRRCWRY